MVEVILGNTYTARNGERFKIIATVDLTSYGYDLGYRFKGRTPEKTDLPFSSSYTAMFDENGKHLRDDATSPYDLIELYEEPPELVLMVDVQVGRTAGAVGTALIRGGLFHGWEISNRFRLVEASFWGLYNSVTPEKPEETVNGEAYIISLAEGTETREGLVASALIAYRACGENYIATLSIPEKYLKDLIEP